MRKVMQIFRIRKIGSLLLVLLALVAIFPVFFSVTGSLMGQKELNDLLGAVLTADSGSASGQAVSYVFWRVLPLYPTLRSYVKVLLDSANDAHLKTLCRSASGLTGILCDVLEFRKDYCRSSGRADPGGSTGSVGICQISFSGKKSAVYDLCGIDDDALSGNDAQ